MLPIKCLDHSAVWNVRFMWLQRELASKQAGTCFLLPSVKGALLGLHPDPRSQGFFIKQSLGKMHKQHSEQSLNAKLPIFKCTSWTRGCSAVHSVLGPHNSFITGCTLSYLQQQRWRPPLSHLFHHLGRGVSSWEIWMWTSSGSRGSWIPTCCISTLITEWLWKCQPFSDSCGFTWKRP